jgi:hypothetical protein
VTHARNCLYLEGDWQCAGGCTYDADEHLRTVTAERDAALAKLAAVEGERANDLRVYDGVVAEVQQAIRQRDEARAALATALAGWDTCTSAECAPLRRERDEARAALAARCDECGNMGWTCYAPVDDEREGQRSPCEKCELGHVFQCGVIEGQIRAAAPGDGEGPVGR